MALVSLFADQILSHGDHGLGTTQIVMISLGVLLVLVDVFAPEVLFRDFNPIKIKIALFFQFLYKKYLVEVLTFLSIGGMYFYQAIHQIFPMGYAGLYMLMAEAVKFTSFDLPSTVPFYGPGGIPYAYPPAALIVGGFFINVLGIPTLIYLRWMPPLIGMICMVALYALVKRLTGSRAKGMLGAFLFAAMLENYLYHITAAGSVRGPALLCMLIGLYYSWGALQKGRRSEVLFASIFLGLTVLTHLTYALFFVLTLATFTLFSGGRSFQRRLIVFAGVCAGGAVVSAIWWLPLLMQHGIQIFQGVFATHRGTDFLIKLFQPVQLINILFDLFTKWGSVPLIGLALMGMVYALWLRRWMLPAWFTLTFIFIGEGNRFLILIGAVMVSEMLVEAVQFVWKHSASQLKDLPHYALSMAVLLAFCYGGAFYQITALQPALSPDILKMGTWFQNTPPQSQYLFISNSHDTAEWLPYLFKRTPALGHWGAEWNGDYRRQYDRWESLLVCVQNESLSCVDGLMQDAGLEPEYYIVPTSLTHLMDEINQEPRWKTAFITPDYSVFERQK